MKFLLGLLMMGEGLLAGLATMQDLPTPFAARDPVTVLIVVARAVVGIGLFAGGWMLVRRAPPAAPIASTALFASGALRVLELGFRLGPTDLSPGLRWPAALAYAAYVALALAVLRRA